MVKKSPYIAAATDVDGRVYICTQYTLQRSSPFVSPRISRRMCYTCIIYYMCSSTAASRGGSVVYTFNVHLSINYDDHRKYCVYYIVYFM